MPLLFVKQKYQMKDERKFMSLACDGVTDKARQRLDLPEEMKMKN